MASPISPVGGAGCEGGGGKTKYWVVSLSESWGSQVDVRGERTRVREGEMDRSE